MVESSVAKWNNVQEEDTHLFFFPPVLPYYRQEAHRRRPAKSKSAIGFVLGVLPQSPIMSLVSSANDVEATRSIDPDALQLVIIF